MTEIRAVEVKDDEYTMFVVANGISYTVKFEPDDGKIDIFTIEKTTKKKSACTML